MFRVKYHLFFIFNHTSNMAVQSIAKYRGKPTGSSRCKRRAGTDVGNEIFAVDFVKRIMETE
jgi:hypothetical protein